MDALRVGGLVSGLDTNSIIDSLMKAAKEPINILNNQVSDLTYEKSVYKGLISDLNDLKKSLLPLKFESTFKSKKSSSSVPAVADGQANVDTAPGSYTINVKQLAQPAFAKTMYVHKSLLSSGAGVKGIKSSVSEFDNIEGTHKVKVTKNSDTMWTALDVFTPNEESQYFKSTGSSIDKTEMDVNGNLLKDIKTKADFSFSLNGKTQKVSVDMDYKSGTNINDISADLENKINTAINDNFFKKENSLLAVRSDKDETSGAFKFSFYSISSENKVTPLGFTEIKPADNENKDDKNVKGNKDGKDKQAEISVISLLGLDTKDKSKDTSISDATESKNITNIISAGNALDLQKLLNDKKGGLLKGAELIFEEDGLKEGSFSVNQADTVNSNKASKTVFKGGVLNNAKNIIDDPKGKTAKDKINDALNASIKDNILFDTAASDATNGFITINGIKIEIGDYTKLSPNALMAKINGSGAGITASFDMETRTFKLENNVTGSGKIAIGTGDSSNILSLMKIPVTSGGTYTYGQREGKLETELKIDKAGFSMPVISGVFTVNGVSIYVDSSNDTVKDVITKINKSGADVNVTYDQGSDKFTITSKDGKPIKVGGKDDTSNFLQSIGLSYDMKKETSVGTVGKNSIFTVNGTKYERKDNEIKDVISGMTFNLYGEGTSVIKVDINTEAAVDAFADFASKYNNLVNKLAPMEISKEDRDKYSKPLTEDRKKGMSQDDVKDYIKQYQAVHYYDIINKSPELRRLKSSIRDQVFNNVNLPDNKFKSLNDIGLNIAGGRSHDITLTRVGLLLDVTTDKKALAKYIRDNTDFADKVKNNSDEIYRFFSAQNKVTIPDGEGRAETKITDMGWSRSFDTYIINNTTATSSLSKKAGINGTIDQRIKSLKKQIDTKTDRAQSYLERMWSEFSAMEQKVQKANSQASYLTQLSSKKAA